MMRAAGRLLPGRSAFLLAACQTAPRRCFTTSSLLYGAVIPYKLADIGEGITEVQVLNVRVKAGDRIEEFDPICEVQSDKATVDITSRYSGVVKAVHIVKGQTAHVGQTIIDINTDDGPAEAPAAEAPPPPAAAPPAATAASTGAVTGGAAIPYKLADIGEGITEVQVLNVRVKAGDRIEEFDPLCEVQSDKATVDITSRYSGVVKAVYVEAGTTAKVGSVLLDIVPEGHEAAPSNSAAQQQSPSSPSSHPAAADAGGRGGGKALATPATRFLAREHKVDLARVPATGKGGRVTKEDVLRFVAGGPATASAPVAATTAAAPTSAATPTGTTVSGLVTEPGDTVVPIVGVRRGMVKTMTQAAAIATFTFSEDYELTRLIAMRAALKDVVKERSQGKVKLSFMPFFLKAASIAMRQHPDINAHCPPDCAATIRRAAHNFGFAMDTPNGLIVPVIHHVEQKSVLEIAMDMQALIERGKANRLTTTDMSGGTFTLSNIGAIGATTTTPVLLPPQVAIAAIGRLQKLPRFDAKGSVYPANLVCISFTADHRVVDGASMVRFANTYKELLENPDNFLVDLR
ncbi:putative mitochondrial dihydrolipoamide branched chain transacylase [Leptomonas pyrrhocoris]|uniref:Dihydrolipoamide acetyltransferase component of pyruvate dehydrogenase complex n=1 Tax=Leptomonas pyrrhocoris TaxID=157538 RepID=A0A0M9G290_LEPPY|nr:putative mitochondrial dihydrolipoamide branched chain transacylase [Leptomonas pyrrhocoris]XP_015659203.1 putative mitochondrial dihydrolipoamide branched chain transacylase [Leptomonas pyrrhocoris]XP_015659204.1 putative mitochondrial dihydrolipoamide branched chain transacylase [Leptomonas pyrrhocoris]XP_015659205.1 putative mitochondrial dihydrolipoamide branched chain transacylase [Leptomonas pyrrhocoris]KPA80763.1 putative mitochondrial dihydrolipoamide branched chain transacylase [Lep|eukprot:XP_015659202.1 putative mitochondrial dihydrolipoamide branched chain transacylase [Leptomonas pyrrhocoris]